MIGMLEMKSLNPPRRSNHLFPGHGASIGLQPAAPETRYLIGQMPDIHMIPAGQHQIGLQGVIAILDIDRRSILVLRIAAGPGSRSGLWLQLVPVKVDLVQEGLDIFLHRQQHDIAHAGEILTAQAVSHPLPLVEAQADGHRMLSIELLELRQTILNDFQGLQTRLQVDAPFLKFHCLGQILLDIGQQTAVIEI
jgi:hypothetical protein